VRQKWSVVWPQLENLPTGGVRLLDAGCGDGRWTLEIAARRPNWTLVGIDVNHARIADAEAARARLGLDNVSFVQADFRDASFLSGFDVVLSIASAHYLVASGSGSQLFRVFAGWLKPGGVLCLLGPRADTRSTPFSSRLPHPAWHDVFSADDLTTLCGSAGLQIESLSGCIGPSAILAKQLSWAFSKRSVAVRGLLYPVGLVMTSVDRLMPGDSPGSLMWLLKARSPLQLTV
jgi:SAM-dependent methyltransferase